MNKHKHHVTTKQTNTPPNPDTMATGGMYGGYDYNFVDGDPPDRFICTICTLVARDPQQVTCCYNTFCKTCLEHLKQSTGQHTKCPLCKEPLNFFKDGKINREIISLKVYCTNSEEGCEWKGTINETDTSIEAHLNDSCPYQLIPCTNECGVDVRRSTLETHLTENCPKRLVKCQYCRTQDKHQIIISSSHLDECPDYPLKCSNEECEEVIPRRLLATHNETCPKAIITCEYNTVGCNKRMKREEKEEHNKESVQEHLQMTKEHLQMTKEELQLAKEEVQKEVQLTKEEVQEELKLAKKEVQMAKETIESLKLTQHTQVSPPFVAKLMYYTQKKQENKDWYSPGFHTSPGGYKMRLSVDPNGYGDAEGTHVSCYICLMSGKHDDTLEWPFQGEVTIELLNQLEDKNHKECTSHYNGSTPEECKQRVPKGEDAKGWGMPQFISHSELEYNPFTNCQYLKDDSLYFRVSVKATSKTKPWLAGVRSY